MQWMSVENIHKFKKVMYPYMQAKRLSDIKFLSNPALEQLIMRWHQNDLDDKIEGPLRIACPTEYFDDLCKSESIKKEIYIPAKIKIENKEKVDEYI